MTIGPAGGEAERRRLIRWHAAGVALGAGVMALSLTLVGALVQEPLRQAGDVAVLVAGGIVLGWAVRSAFGVGLPYPRSHWQVPEHWRYTMPTQFTLLGYGFLLGLGFLTDVVLAAYWVLVVATVVVASLPIALAAWAGYAVTRIAVTARAVSRADFEGAGDDDDIQPAQCAPGAPALRRARLAAGGVLAGVASVIATGALM